MRNLQTDGPSFYKIILALDDFIPQVCIPPSFVAEYRQFLSKEATLETDGLPGKSWDVKIEQIDNHYFLTRGWEKFVKENSLKIFDFLVFRFIKGSRLVRVTAFDSNGCEKEAPTHISEQQKRYATRQHSKATKSSPEESRNESEDLAQVDDFQTKKISFTITWKGYMRNSMLIRGSICKTKLAKAKTVKLRNLAGDVHEVRVYNTAVGQVGFGAGWAAFVDASNFILDETYQFKSIPSGSKKILLQLSLINKESSSGIRGQELASFKKPSIV